MTDTFQNRLNQALQIRNIKSVELAELTGISKARISQYTNGVYIPKSKGTYALSKALNVNEAWLMGLDVPMERQPVPQSNIRSYDTENIYMIPVFDSVSAGFGATAVDYITEYAPAFIKNPHDAGDYIYINVEGDSMFPKIEDGDRILVRRQASVDSGSVAVVLVDGEDALVKKVVYGKTWVELHSFNPMYKTMRFDDEEVQRLQVLGLVKEVIKEL